LGTNIQLHIRKGSAMVKICVSSSFPERLNVNRGLVDSLAEGFQTVLGKDQVQVCPYSALPGFLTRKVPDLLVMIGSALHSSGDYSAISQACKRAGVTFVFWTVEDPYEFDANSKFTQYADIIISNDAYAVKYYPRDQVFHLPLAAPERIAKSLVNFTARPLDIFFCGVGFKIRQRIIVDAHDIFARYNSRILGDNWAQTPDGIVQNHRVPADVILDYYHNSKVVLNIGRDHAYANETRGLKSVTPGPRTFEAAMTGCVQFYYQPSAFLADYFEPDKEIVTFNDVFELEEKLDYLMNNPLEAMAIAKRAQKRCLKDHTFARRAEQLLAIVRSAIPTFDASRKTATKIIKVG
tara:strand:+ start:64338 stop:65390 length:1053 start_codon:yes stop_codon:yes gene_type:complete